LVYVCTDPVVHEIRYSNGDEDIRTLVEEHDDVVTFGENIGTPSCSVPPLPRLRARTRQPIVLDFWEAGPSSRLEFTTIGNWKQAGRDSKYQGETYYWSKHYEFLRFIDLPHRVSDSIELAMGLVQLCPGDLRLLKE